MSLESSVAEQLEFYATVIARLELRLIGLEGVVRLLVAEAERRGVPLQAAVAEWLANVEAYNG